MTIDNSNIDTIVSILEKRIKREAYVTKISKKDKDPFKVLVSTVLSSRTKDEITEEASERLFSVVKKPEDILKLSLSRLENLIYPVGFYKVKAKRLKELSDYLIKKYDGKVPDDLEELLKLPGVGRKTANLVITLAFNKYGICVDTHVHRIVNRWGYVRTKSPVETEVALRKKLPKKYWKKINNLLVVFGKSVCKPVRPMCSSCAISNYCPKIGVKVHS
ncbi:MAG: endonuclease III [Thaumarchaeota archaeon]|nr:endonuclease III [Nitrososphaerota archaeon]